MSTGGQSSHATQKDRGGGHSSQHGRTFFSTCVIFSCPCVTVLIITQHKCGWLDRTLFLCHVTGDGASSSRAPLLVLLEEFAFGGPVVGDAAVHRPQVVAVV